MKTLFCLVVFFISAYSVIVNGELVEPYTVQNSKALEENISLQNIMLTTPSLIPTAQSENKFKPVKVQVRYSCGRKFTLHALSVCALELRCDPDTVFTACQRLVSDDWIRSKCCPSRR